MRILSKLFGKSGSVSKKYKALCLVGAFFISFISFTSVCAYGDEIVKIEYLGNYPSNKQGTWTDKLQGIGNDSDNWFFTQNMFLWKVPININLKNTKKMRPDSKKWPGVLKVGMPDALKRKGYNHFGDLDVAHGYVFVPIEGSNPPVIAVFKAKDLSFVDYAELPNKTRSGWCAISPKGQLFTSHNIINKEHPIDIYSIDWDYLNRSGKLKLQWESSYELTGIPKGYGKDISVYVQGGDFSTDGKYLFIVNGKVFDKTHKKGVWVFSNNNYKSGSFVMKSNQNKGFKYEYKPAIGQEPEGITYWDIDNDKRNKGKKGQLHVLLMNQIKGAVWIKHYRIHHK